MPPVTPSHYAKHRGCALQTVMEAIKQGRLEKCLTKKPSGRYLVDVSLADTEWAANTDTGQGGPAHAKNQPATRPNQSNPSETMTYAEARAAHERFKARLAELEMEEREGKLVAAEAVKSEAFRSARLIRDALLNMPDRVAGEFAAETNQFKIHQRLTAEIRRALEDLKLES